jgi:hypothetical protein
VKSYSDKAFDTLVDVAINGSSDSIRIAAANSILERGYGKPKSDEVEVVELPVIVIRRGWGGYTVCLARRFFLRAYSPTRKHHKVIHAR